MRRVGFSRESLVTITGGTEHRHELLLAETADAPRGAIVGGSVAGVGLAVAAGVLASPPILLVDVHFGVAALLGGLVGVLVGGGIGALVGSATGHQVQEHLENAIEHGDVVLAVHTAGSLAATAERVLLEAGCEELSRSLHGGHHAAVVSA